MLKRHYKIIFPYLLFLVLIKKLRVLVDMHLNIQRRLVLFMILSVILATSIPSKSFADIVNLNIKVEDDIGGIKAYLVYNISEKFSISQNKNDIYVNFQKEINPTMISLPQDTNIYLAHVNLSPDKKSVIFSMISSDFVSEITTMDNGAILNINKIIPVSQNSKDPKTDIDPKRNPLLKGDYVVTTTNIPINKVDVKKEQKALHVKEVSNNFDTIKFEKSNADSVKWRFEWKKKVAAAAFFRGENLWIIFNNSRKFNLDNVKEFYKDDQILAEQIESSEFTILRFKIKNISSVRAYQEGKNWIIELPLPKQNIFFVPSNVISEYVTPFSRGVFFPVNGVAESMLNVLDPEVGDIISILCLYSPDYGVPKERSFIDFKLFRSAQGFVVKVSSDDAYINIIKAGVEIIVPFSRLPYAENAQTFLDKNSNENIDKSKNIEIKYLGKNKFVDQKKLLDREMAESNDKNHSISYFRLAKFYYSNDMYHEASQALSIMVSDKNLESFSNSVYLMLGISEFMKHRNVEAKAAFDKIDTSFLDQKTLPEVKFWKKLLNLQLTGEGKSIDFLTSLDSFAGSYSQKIIDKIGLLAIEVGLSRGEDNDIIRNMCKALLLRTTDPLVKNSLQYYLGIVAKNDGDSEAALKTWKKIYEMDDDPFNITRARFAYVSFLYDNQIMNTEDTINELLRLSMKWRGDEVEMSILKKLGDIYYDQKNYIGALHTWKRLVGNFPDFGQALFLSSQMSIAFIRLFTRN